MFNKICNDIKKITCDDYVLLNKENNFLSINVKHQIFDIAKKYNITIIWNKYSNYLIAKKGTYSIIIDYDNNHWNMGYFKYKKVLI